MFVLAAWSDLFVANDLVKLSDSFPYLVLFDAVHNVFACNCFFAILVHQAFELYDLGVGVYLRLVVPNNTQCLFAAILSHPLAGAYGMSALIFLLAANRLVR